MAAYAYTTKPKGVAQIHGILGCTFISGACVTHQRMMDKPRPGCPYADSIMHQSQATSYTRRRA